MGTCGADWVQNGAKNQLTLISRNLILLLLFPNHQGHRRQSIRVGRQASHYRLDILRSQANGGHACW